MSSIIRSNTAEIPLDTFYTPRSIASTLINALRVQRPAIIADFTAGVGSLVRAAECVWPDATFVASDVCDLSVRRMRRTHPQWLVSRCDFLSQRSRAASKTLKSVERRVSAALLNPPFSCRGAARHGVTFAGQHLKCSTAVAFLVEALKYLSSDGELAALLPVGVINNERDREIWACIEQQFDWTCGATFPRGAFPGCAATTVVISMRRRKARKMPDLAKISQHQVTSAATGRRSETRQQIKIIRGSVQMHQVDPLSRGPRLVHSTDLRESQVIPSARRGAATRASVCGPAVLLPRVGNLSRGKIALYTDDETLVLSDCVLALKCASEESAKEIRELLIERFELVRDCYTGTGAPFITLGRLRKLVNELGIHTGT